MTVNVKDSVTFIVMRAFLWSVESSEAF